jgi:four helix bundle protein
MGDRSSEFKDRESSVKGERVVPKSFEDLDAWKAARCLAADIYAFCRRPPLNSDLGLCTQIRRAAISVMNNPAEGWESLHPDEKKQFYNYSRRSCGEVRSMSSVLLDNPFLTPSEHEALLQSCIRTGKRASGLIRSLDSRC